MLIKEPDDQSQLFVELEALAIGQSREAKQALEELRRRKAGQKGESESVYLINFDFESSQNWAVLHDLRLEHKGRAAQIDHVLINRWLEVYVLETKHFRDGLKITDDGEFMRWNSYKHTFEGMPSPLEQNDRHIAVLKDAFDQIDLPTRLGLRISPTIHSFVLVAPSARIDRPKHFDASRVIKADQLKTNIWKDIDKENSLFSLVKTAAKIVSSETIQLVAKQLAALHIPAPTRPPRSSKFAVSEPTVAAHGFRDKQTQDNPTEPHIAQPPSDTLACKKCGTRAGKIVYGKYGYYFQCNQCATNTSIRFTCSPSHAPRLRKAGNEFYRECPECNSSVLYFTNS